MREEHYQHAEYSNLRKGFTPTRTSYYKINNALMRRRKLILSMHYIRALGLKLMFFKKNLKKLFSEINNVLNLLLNMLRSAIVLAL